jgi:L-lactate utilization protein LutB
VPPLFGLQVRADAAGERPEYANVCPSVARYDFHSYSGGGRLNIGAAMLKNGFNYTDRLLDIVYNCQMCGACGVSCNYAMDMEVLQPISEFRMQCVKTARRTRRSIA